MTNEKFFPIGPVVRAAIATAAMLFLVGDNAENRLLLQALDLPQHLSPNALLDVLNCITDTDALWAAVRKMEENNGTEAL